MLNKSHSDFRGLSDLIVEVIYSSYLTSNLIISMLKISYNNRFNIDIAYFSPPRKTD